MSWLGLSGELKSSGVIGVICIGGGSGLIPGGAVTASTLRPETGLIRMNTVGKGAVGS